MVLAILLSSNLLVVDLKLTASTAVIVLFQEISRLVQELCVHITGSLVCASLSGLASAFFSFVNASWQLLSLS